MNGWIDHVRAALARPVGTVVIVGAGAGDWAQACEVLAPREVQLVEGDAEAAANLQDLVAGRPGWTLHELVLGPGRSRLPWHRYNLPALNGPLEAGDLKRVFPRLQRVQTREVETCPIEEFVGGLASTGDAALAHLLLIDTPGQEHALLQALGERLLQRFEFVVVRGCTQALGSGGTPVGAEAPAMSARCFQQVHGDGDSEPLWPVTVYRFDDLRWREKQWVEQARQYDEAIRQRDQRVAELFEQLRAQSVEMERLQDAMSTAEQKAAERATHCEFLTRARDEAIQRAQSLAAQHIDHSQEMLKLSTLVEERNQQKAELVQRLAQARAERDELSGSLEHGVNELTSARQALDECRQQASELRVARDEEHARLQQRIDLLQERVSQLQAVADSKSRADDFIQQQKVKLEALAEAKTAAECQAAERAEHFDRLTRARDEALQRLQKLESQRAEQQQETLRLEVIVKERSQQMEGLAQRVAQLEVEREELAGRVGHGQTELRTAQKSLEESVQQASALRTSLDEARAQLRERGVQLQTVADSKGRADEFIQQQKVKLEALAEAKTAAERKAAERAEHYDRLTRARDEQSRLAAELQQQLRQCEEHASRLESARATLATERDVQARLAADRQQGMVEKARQVQRLEGELAEARGWIQSLHGELERAEQQLEILKDVFVQESGL